MKRDIIPTTLSLYFARYGRIVTRHPWPFLILPILISVALGVGMINLEITKDVEYLYTPLDAPRYLFLVYSRIYV